MAIHRINPHLPEPAVEAYFYPPRPPQAAPAPEPPAEAPEFDLDGVVRQGIEEFLAETTKPASTKNKRPTRSARG